MALSTVSRRFTTGTFDLENDRNQREYLLYWLEYMFNLKNLQTVL